MQEGNSLAHVNGYLKKQWKLELGVRKHVVGQWSIRAKLCHQTDLAGYERCSNKIDNVWAAQSCHDLNFPKDFQEAIRSR